MDRINPNISQLKLPRLALFAYGLGDFASSMCWTFIGSYLSVFYTDILGLAPAIASVLMMCARISDALFDPIFGAIAERTHSRYGRFRPYILFGAPVLAVLSVGCFVNWGTGNKLTIILAFVAYLFCGLAYTVVNLSYGSLSTVMTTDPDDISQLNSYRMMGMNLANVILSAVTPFLLILFSGSNRVVAGSYFKVAVLFAILSLPLFYFMVLNCRERITPIHTTKIEIRSTLKAVTHNYPLMLIMIIQILAMSAAMGRLGILAYYCIYNIKNIGLMSAFMALPSLGTVAGIFLTKNFTVKIGKKKMAALGYSLSAVTLIIMFIVGEITKYKSVTILLILNTLYGFFCFFFPIPMAMVNDAINYGEYKFKIRSDGTAYAVTSLATKFGQAIGVSGAVAVIGVAGYVPNRAQTLTTMTGINFATNLLIAIIFLLCLIPLAIYPLNEKMSLDLIDKLKTSRENVNLDGSSELQNETLTEKGPANVILTGRSIESFSAMASGQVLRLDSIQDSSLTGPIIGEGFAIRPDKGTIVAPFDAIVINIFSAHHAIGIQTESGIQVLIHFGINTSDLQGRPFTIYVKQGERVQSGQIIASVDLEMLEMNQKGTEIVALFTNPRQIKQILIEYHQHVSLGEKVGSVMLK